MWFSRIDVRADSCGSVRPTSELLVRPERPVGLAAREQSAALVELVEPALRVPTAPQALTAAPEALGVLVRVEFRVVRV
jgi:hypothetical protein